MKALLVAEYRDGKLLGNINELLGFAAELAADAAVFLVGKKDNLPKFSGKLYLADVDKYGEYNPDSHKALLQKAIEQERPDLIVLSHSSYGWDLAPRLAFALKTSQISEVVALADGGFVVPACNAKLRRQVKSLTAKTVLTLQAGAFQASETDGVPTVTLIDAEAAQRMTFTGYEATAG